MIGLWAIWQNIEREKKEKKKSTYSISKNEPNK